VINLAAVLASHEREVVGDVRGRDTEFRAHARLIANLSAPAIDLHDALA
jgi:hypothetical protein